MPRNQEIKRIFEIADDSMQGVVGYYLYIEACNKSSHKTDLIKYLPKKDFPITFEWNRYLEPTQLCNAMEKLFIPFTVKIALIAIISIFESTLQGFREQLNISNKGGYKRRLKWAFNLVQESILGAPDMTRSIPQLCLNVDHARRIRNLWLHNNGIINELYKTDGLTIDNNKPIVIEDYENLLRQKSPILITPDGFSIIYKSHISLLHHLHDTIQRKYYGQKRSYTYKAAHKGIEWHRMLIGK